MGGRKHHMPKTSSAFRSSVSIEFRHVAETLNRQTDTGPCATANIALARRRVSAPVKIYYLSLPQTWRARFKASVTTKPATSDQCSRRDLCQPCHSRCVHSLNVYDSVIRVRPLSVSARSHHPAELDCSVRRHKRCRKDRSLSLIQFVSSFQL